MQKIALQFYQTFYIAAIALPPHSLWAGSFTENFSSYIYWDAGNTTADWNVNVGHVQLPSRCGFSQPGGLVNWGGRIRAIHCNGSEWLLGGAGAKINRCDSSNWLHSDADRYGDPDGHRHSRADGDPNPNCNHQTFGNGLRHRDSDSDVNRNADSNRYSNADARGSGILYADIYSDPRVTLVFADPDADIDFHPNHDLYSGKGYSYLSQSVPSRPSSRAHFENCRIVAGGCAAYLYGNR